jgi:hypothetical protein
MAEQRAMRTMGRIGKGPFFGTTVGARIRQISGFQGQAEGKVNG